MTLVNTCKSNTNKEGKYITSKVIIESGSLNDLQIIIATQICIKCNVNFVKTSTGKTSRGANIDNIKTIYNTLRSAGSIIKIKASGGIKDITQINQFMPYVDRFGIGFGTVDKLNNMSTDSSKSNY
jgi:deoxyribose-phosphate aldolase